MELELTAVKRVFQDVLEGRMTREAADRWAYDLVQHAERGSLTFSPPTAKDRIWEGVMFLYGVDIQKSPGEYLHNDDDIRTAMAALGN